MGVFTTAFLLTAAVSRLATAQAARPDSTNDPYCWLEEMTGAQAMDWVESEDARTSALLEKDPRYAANYASAKPVWTTVLDLDVLAKAENANWVWKGADCDSPGEQRCLLNLSDDGEDADGFGAGGHLRAGAA